MSPLVSIRKLRPEDFEEVLALWYRTWNDALPHLDGRLGTPEAAAVVEGLLWRGD